MSEKYFQTYDVHISEKVENCNANPHNAWILLGAFNPFLYIENYLYLEGYVSDIEAVETSRKAFNVEIGQMFFLKIP